MQSNTEHLALRRALLERRETEHANAAASLRVTIAAKERELADRPEKIVEKYLEISVLQEATAEAERALRSRDWAYGTMLQVSLLHRETEPGRCRCGKGLDRCHEFTLLDCHVGLERWEAKQVERRKQGLSHALPPNHPAVLDRRG